MSPEVRALVAALTKLNDAPFALTLWCPTCAEQLRWTARSGTLAIYRCPECDRRVDVGLPLPDGQDVVAVPRSWLQSTLDVVKGQFLLD